MALSLSAQSTATDPDLLPRLLTHSGLFVSHQSEALKDSVLLWPRGDASITETFVLQEGTLRLQQRVPLTSASAPAPVSVPGPAPDVEQVLSGFCQQIPLYAQTTRTSLLLSAAVAQCLFHAFDGTKFDRKSLPSGIQGLQELDWAKQNAELRPLYEQWRERVDQGDTPALDDETDAKGHRLIWLGLYNGFLAVLDESMAEKTGLIRVRVHSFDTGVPRHNFAYQVFASLKHADFQDDFVKFDKPAHTFAKAVSFALRIFVEAKNGLKEHVKRREEELLVATIKRATFYNKTTACHVQTKVSHEDDGRATLPSSQTTTSAAPAPTSPALSQLPQTHPPSLASTCPSSPSSTTASPTMADSADNETGVVAAAPSLMAKSSDNDVEKEVEAPALSREAKRKKKKNERKKIKKKMKKAAAAVDAEAPGEPEEPLELADASVLARTLAGFSFMGPSQSGNGYLKRESVAGPSTDPLLSRGGHARPGRSASPGADQAVTRPTCANPPASTGAPEPCGQAALSEKARGKQPARVGVDETFILGRSSDHSQEDQPAKSGPQKSLRPGGLSDQAEAEQPAASGAADKSANSGALTEKARGNQPVKPAAANAATAAPSSVGEFKFDGFDPRLRCLLPDCGKMTSCWDGVTTICPACGPESYTRYCCREHLYADVQRHWVYECSKAKIAQPIDRDTIRKHQLPKRAYVKGYQQNLIERHRQAVYRAMEDSDFFIFNDVDMIDEAIEYPTKAEFDAVRGTGEVVCQLVFPEEMISETTRERFNIHLNQCLMFGAPMAYDSCLVAMHLIQRMLILSGNWTEQMLTLLCMQLAGEWGNFKVPQSFYNVEQANAMWRTHGILPPLLPLPRLPST